MATQRYRRAKLSRPRMTSVLERERLYRCLEKSSDFQGVWVLGPAGAGKTTLVSSYIESRDMDCLWYQLDPGDSDVATFFYHLVEACGVNGLASLDALPSLTPEYFHDIAAFSRRFFGELFSRINKETVLVLDNYQEVRPDSLLHDVVRQCLEVTPGHVRLIAVSRQEPPPSLARARANNTLDILGWNEIKLRPEETQALADLVGGKRLAAPVVESLHRKTGGWIAGLILMLKRPEIKHLESRHLDAFTPAEIFDYFGSELFSNAPPDLQRFLMTSAMLPEMVPSQVRELTGREESAELLERLNREHYFTDRRIGQEITYVYHPLFREFLLSCAARLMPAEESASIREKAAGLLESVGRVDEAFVLYREVGAVEDMIRIILSSAPEMMLHSRQLTLLEWILSLPEELRASMPWLMYWQGVCLLGPGPAQARPLLEKAWEMFKARNDLPGMLLSLAGVMNAIIFAIEPAKALDPWIGRLDTAYSMAPALPMEVESQVVLSMLNALVFRQPDRPSFSRWEGRARELLDTDLPVNLKIQLVLPLFMYEVNCGEFAAAAHDMDSYVQRVEEEDVSPLFRTIFESQSLWYCWAAGNFERAEVHYTRVKKIFDETGIRLVEPFVMCHMAIVALCTGDMVRANTLIKRLDTAYQHTGAWGVGLYYLVRTWYALLTTDLPKADFFSNKMVEYTLEAGAIHHFAYAYLGRALALQLQDEQEQAEAMLETALGWCERLPALYLEFCCRLTQAEFALERKDREAAVDALDLGLPLGREKGYWNTVLWRPEPMAELCVLALEEGIETEYARELIQRRDLNPGRLPLHLEEWPWALRLYTLGRFEILRHDGPLSFKGKVQKRPLNLLQALVALGGNEVPEAELLDMLWPDLDGSDAHNAFTMALHRLRKTLGVKDVLQLSGGKLSLDKSLVWADVWALEEGLDRVEKTWSKGETSLCEPRIRRILEFYRGPFLSEVEESWILTIRERIRYRVLRAMRRLVTCHEEQHQWSASEEVCRKAMEIEPLREDFCRGLMRCCLEQGRKAEALEVFHSCRERLSEELGVAPDQRTQALYKSIVESE